MQLLATETVLKQTEMIARELAEQIKSISRGNFMTFWHMQMHPNDDENFKPEKIKEILKEKLVIGLGEREDKKKQIENFKNKIKIGDIVAIKNGKTPIALVEVETNYYLDENIDEEFDWFCHRRGVKILDFYSENDNFTIRQPRGALGICLSDDTQTTKVIKNWYKRVVDKMETDKIKEILLTKKQIILQGPPGTGKTRLAKIIAENLIKPKDTQEVTGIKQDLDDFFKDFNPSNEINKAFRDKRENAIFKFDQNFNIDKLEELTFEEFYSDDKNKETFCWWMKTGLKALIEFTREEITKDSIFKNCDSNQDTDNFKSILLELAKNGKETKESKKIFYDKFVLKVLNTYNKKNYFPFYDETAIEKALDLFDFNYENMNIWEKNKKLNELFLDKKSDFKSEVDSYDFAFFLYDKFKGVNNDKFLKYNNGEYKIIQFHPGYSYEDFVRGISAELNEDGNINYNVENRALSEYAKKAKDDPDTSYVLIIDEINRANLPSVLGELIYALEYRGEKVESMYAIDEDNGIVIPPNLYIIGTMNTADRSVGHIDYAIRRRFAFIDVHPDESVITYGLAKKLFLKVKELFKNNLSSDFKKEDIMIGHSYFLTDNEKDLKIKFEYEIKPILKEYVKDGILKESAIDTIENLLEGKS